MTSRLDYVLVDKSLRVVSKTILRKGICLRWASAGDRYATIGQVGIEARIIVRGGEGGGSSRRPGVWICRHH